MNLLVDTCVWSLLLRRRRVDDADPFVTAFRRHVEGGDCIHLVGNILQELLDGVSNVSEFERLNRLLAPFPLILNSRETFVLASKLRNYCRGKGIQASPTDFLIASVCIENGFPLLTSDRDFLRIAAHSKLVLL